MEVDPKDKDTVTPLHHAAGKIKKKKKKKKETTNNKQQTTNKKRKEKNKKEETFTFQKKKQLSQQYNLLGNGHLLSTKALVSGGANINAEDEQGTTPPPRSSLSQPRPNYPTPPPTRLPKL